MGVFQQQVSGGDMQFSSKEPVQRDNAAKLAGFVGEQAVEANRGYHDAELKDETEDAIYNRLGNAYIQFAQGKNPDLADLAGELKKYKNAYDQGIMNNTQLEIRVEAARKKATNKMPGRAREINQLSMQTMGQYDAVLKDLAAREDAASKANAWADKQTRTWLSENGVPGPVAFNTPMDVIYQEYGPVINANYTREEESRRLDYVKKADENTARQARKSSGDIIYGESAKMEADILSIASNLSGELVSDISQIPVEIRGQVIAQHQAIIAERRNMYDGKMTKADYKDFDKDWESVNEQAKVYHDTVNGIQTKEAYEGYNASQKVKTEVRMRQNPGMNDAMFMVENFVRFLDPTMQVRIMQNLNANVIPMYQADSGSLHWQDSGNVNRGLAVMTDLSSVTNLEPEMQQYLETYIDNMANGVHQVQTTDNLLNMSTALANPKSTETLKKYSGKISGVLGNMTRGIASNLVNAMIKRGQYLVKGEGNSYSFVGGTPRENREMTASYGTILTNMEYINNNVGTSPEFMQLIKKISAENQEQTDTNNKTSQQQTGKPLAGRQLENFTGTFKQIMDTPNLTEEEKDTMLGKLVDGYRKDGYKIDIQV